MMTFKVTHKVSKEALLVSERDLITFIEKNLGKAILDATKTNKEYTQELLKLFQSNRFLVANVVGHELRRVDNTVSFLPPLKYWVNK